MAQDWVALKKEAAEQAVTLVQSGMVVGLGTGSTAVHAVRAIGRLLQNGRLHNIVAIPTSDTTAQEAQALGIPLATFDQQPKIDITIDGADEIDPHLNLIKGLGGALLREKVVATVSAQMIVVADYSKRVTLLGTKAPVPVEVIPFAQQPATAYLQTLGARVVLRPAKESSHPFMTDEGNYILDCHFADGIPQPHELAQAIKQQPGVVEHGLFLGIATQAMVATPDGVTAVAK